MEFIIIGIVTFFNLAILLKKYQTERYVDMLLDVLAFIILSKIFGGTLGGMMIAMIGSMLLSLYLLFAIKKSNVRTI